MLLGDPDGAGADAGVVPGEAGDLDDVARVRGVDEEPAAHVDADVVVPRVEEDQVARHQLAHRDVRPGPPLRPGVVVEVDAELGVDVHGQPGAVEAGRAGAAPHVGNAEVALGDRHGLLSERPGGRGGPGAAPGGAAAAAVAAAAAGRGGGGRGRRGAGAGGGGL